MTLSQEADKIRQELEKHNQQHLLKFYDQLTPDELQSLLDDIKTIDLNATDRWIEKYVTSTPEEIVPEQFDPAPYYPLNPEDAQVRQKYDQAKKLGEELIAGGKVAAFVVAGGQGTRLGFDGPKGNFPVSPVKNKPLFQLFAEMIRSASKKYNTALPWYIMTSPLNHNQTVEFFKENAYFGLPKEDVFIFQQGTLPNFAFDGKILLAEKHQIARSPDGHGGSLKALYDSGAIDHMKKRGVKHISYWQVDNALINIFDPLFVGLHAMENSQMSSKTVIKANPTEKVGNFCLVDGRVTVIEYSDLPDEKAHMKNSDGSLAFRLGSIAIHIIDVSFVEQINSKGFSLPFHRAVKKIPHIDEQGNKISPEKPNGVKLETFIFDALPLADNSMILETDRSQEFGPVKNATGVDSVETSQQLQIDRAADWLEAAEVDVPRRSNGSADAIIEISPLFALHKEDIAEKTDKIPHIKPAGRIYIE